MPAVQLAGLRCLGALRDASTIPTLIDHLSASEQMAAVAQQALARLPREVVGPALLAALERKDIRGPVIGVLKELKYYEAIDPLIAIASETDAAVLRPGPGWLAGHRGSGRGRHSAPGGLSVQDAAGHAPRRSREDDCDRLRQVARRARIGHKPCCRRWPVRIDARKVTCLPLLGRLGGEQARQTIRAASRRAGQEPRAKPPCGPSATGPTPKSPIGCWPSPQNSDDKRYSRWALRAYVRVVSLPSDRPPNETLAMLQTDHDAGTGCGGSRADHLARGNRAHDGVRALGRRLTWMMLRWLRPPAPRWSNWRTIANCAIRNMDEFGPILERSPP